MGLSDYSRRSTYQERYFDDRAKEFYELKMGSMIDDEYTSMLLQLLRYLPYLKEEKAKMQIH